MKIFFLKTTTALNDFIIRYNLNFPLQLFFSKNLILILDDFLKIYFVISCCNKQKKNNFLKYINLQRQYFTRIQTFKLLFYFFFQINPAYRLSGDEVDENLVDDADMKKSKLATDISTLRQSVVKLTCENTKLKEDCLLVRRDLQTAMLNKDENTADNESFFFD